MPHRRPPPPPLPSESARLPRVGGLVTRSISHYVVQVAKDASDIVILDDRFSSIVRAVMWGRSVYGESHGACTPAHPLLAAPAACSAYG
jgi:hypothetical protein